MGFHRRHIGNDTVHRLFKSGGASSVIDWYTKGVDALVTEMGLAAQISSVIHDEEWYLLGRLKMEDHITELIQKDLGMEDIKK
jgi:hypothetical protein